jgi:hypothetical protein
VAKDNTFGLLSQYGLDLGTEQDVRTQLRDQRIRGAMSMVAPAPTRANGGGLNTQQQAFGHLGAAVGNAFGEKFRQERTRYGDIPPEIQNRLNTTEQSKDLYARWEASNPTAKAADRMEKYQEIIAETAFKNDLPEVGIGVLRELQDRRLSRQQQEAELEKIGYENKFDRETMDSRVALEMYKAGKEGIVQFYEPGSANPNTGSTGRLGADGTITTKDGRVLGMGDFTLDRPQWDPARYGGGGGGGGGGRGGQDLTPSAEEKLRVDFANAMTMNDGLVGVLDLVKEAGLVGAGNPLGMLGKTTSLVDKYTSYAEGLITMMSPTKSMPTSVLMKDANGKVIDGNFQNAANRAAWAEQNMGWLRTVIPNLPKKAEYANRLIAQISELAYLKAMAQEGGSTRSLSDNDYKQAMIAIGGNLNNPATLAKVLLGDSDRLHSKIGNRFSTYHPDTIKRVIHGDGFERYEEGRRKLEAYRDGSAFAPPAAKPKAGSLPLRKGWTQEDWDALTPEEQASLN